VTAITSGLRLRHSSINAESGRRYCPRTDN
jgi:hypothetical protein